MKDKQTFTETVNNKTQENKKMDKAIFHRGKVFEGTKIHKDRMWQKGRQEY